MLRYIHSGRIKVDKTKNDIAVTFHDSCNYGRSCGMVEEPRELLNLICSDFREMYPNRAENYCCTGGGGAMSMSEYTPQRLKSAKIKADQLKATGAKIVVTTCHNCVDGLADLIKHYNLDMKVTQLVNLCANALVVEPKVEELAPAEAIPAAAVGGSLDGYRILVADDEPDFVTFVSTVLEDNGADVISASDGNQAYALARSEKPDLITLDISMPGKSGIEVFELLRKTPETSQIPICIITGKPEMRKLIYSRPVEPPEGYLNKPVDEDAILFNVRKTLAIERGA